jgi:hypothetical protein
LPAGFFDQYEGKEEEEDEEGDNVAVEQEASTAQATAPQPEPAPTPAPAKSSLPAGFFDDPNIHYFSLILFLFHYLFSSLDL